MKPDECSQCGSEDIERGEGHGRHQAPLYDCQDCGHIMEGL